MAIFTPDTNTHLTCGMAAFPIHGLSHLDFRVGDLDATTACRGLIRGAFARLSTQVGSLTAQSEPCLLASVTPG